MIGLPEILIFLTSVFLGFYLWFKYQNNYWKRKNVPYIKSSWFYGNIKEIFFYTKSSSELFQDLYNNKEIENEPIVGIHLFNHPALLICEPEIIKNIMVKDFHKFPNRYVKADLEADKLASHNLFLMQNPKWKQMRTKLTPIFTSGKMKQMFHLVEEIGHQLDEYLCSLTDGEEKTVIKELKDTAALYTTEAIASVAFGIQANSMKNPDGQFRHNGRHIFRISLWRAFEFTAMFFYPQIISLFGIKFYDKKAENFIRTTVNHAMAEREKSGTRRNDLIDVLLNLRNESLASTDKDDYKFNEDALVAQAALFFTAGYETTAATISFALYELSKFMEIQERLRNEIKDVLIANDGKLTYDSVNEMVYLNMILMETLRMYPPLGFLDRECILSKGEDGYSLEPYSDYKIPHGLPIYVPSYAIHRDPKYFPDPDRFSPERFHPENKGNIDAYTYMPFGLGPHNCIGERLGHMQFKIGLVNFLKNHIILPCEKSHKIMKLEPKTFLTQAEGGVYCNLQRAPLL